MMKMGSSSSMSVNAHTLIRTPKLSLSPTTTITDQDSLFRHVLTTTTTRIGQKANRNPRLFVVHAKGKNRMQYRQPQREMPTLPKIEDDGNPRFVIFVRMSNLYLWYPVSIIAGGTTAKIMVAAKDNFMGKYIYKDTMKRNLAAVIYKDEEEVLETAKRMHRVLQSATKGFRYGYKLVENGNLKAALMNKDVIELPLPDSEEMKTVADKVKDFFKNAKDSVQESFAELTNIGSTPPSTPTTPSTPPKKKKNPRNFNRSRRGT